MLFMNNEEKFLQNYMQYGSILTTEQFVFTVIISQPLGGDLRLWYEYHQIIKFMGEHIKILTAPSEGLNRDVAILRA